MLFLANEERDLSLLFTEFGTGYEGWICYEPFYFSSLEAPSMLSFLICEQGKTSLASSTSVDLRDYPYHELNI